MSVLATLIQNSPGRAIRQTWEGSKSPGHLVTCWNHMGENFKPMTCKFHPRDATASFIGLNLKCPPKCLFPSLWHHFENHGCSGEAGTGWRNKPLGGGLCRFTAPCYGCLLLAILVRHHIYSLSLVLPLP